MPIMNYTTKVDVFATLGEIQGQLVKHGAKKIMQDYDNDGHITALSFLIDTPNGPRGVKLPANVDAVWNVLTKQKVKCDRDQAERVAWRIVKDWVAAQMAILESEMWCRWMRSSFRICSTIKVRRYSNATGRTSFQSERQHEWNKKAL